MRATEGSAARTADASPPLWTRDDKSAAAATAAADATNGVAPMRPALAVTTATATGGEVPAAVAFSDARGKENGGRDRSLATHSVGAKELRIRLSKTRPDDKDG